MMDGKTARLTLAIGIICMIFGLAGLARAQAQAPAKNPNAKYYQMKGTVKSVKPSDHQLVVQHGDIPGFMAAMTMPYRVRNDEDLSKVAPGDQITADVVVTSTEAHLENVKVTGHAPEKGK